MLVLAGGLVLSNKTLATDESKKPNIIVNVSSTNLE